MPGKSRGALRQEIAPSYMRSQALSSRLMLLAVLLGSGSQLYHIPVRCRLQLSKLYRNRLHF